MDHDPPAKRPRAVCCSCGSPILSSEAATAQLLHHADRDVWKCCRCAGVDDADDFLRQVIRSRASAKRLPDGDR